MPESDHHTHVISQTAPYIYIPYLTLGLQPPTKIALCFVMCSTPKTTLLEHSDGRWWWHGPGEGISVYGISKGTFGQCLSTHAVTWNKGWSSLHSLINIVAVLFCFLTFGEVNFVSWDLIKIHVVSFKLPLVYFFVSIPTGRLICLKWWTLFPLVPCSANQSSVYASCILKHVFFFVFICFFKEFVIKFSLLLNWILL